MNAVTDSIKSGFIQEMDFAAPAASDLIDNLVGRYRRTKANIESVVGFIESGDNKLAISYFLRGNKNQKNHHSQSLAELFEAAGAIAQLNSDYWQEAIQLTDVYDFMPAKRRDEWDTLIRTRACPDFEEETVRDTLRDLLANRATFFAERVDGIFRALSGDHVTNRPEGFGKRMILARAFNEYGHTVYGTIGYISDLRQVIAKFMGRDEPPHYATSDALIEARVRHGEWLTLDGGALRVRAYLKGTAHLEVHPEMAWRLNMILANLYPMAIPPQFRQKPKRAPKDFVLMDNPLPFAVLSQLATMKVERHQPYRFDRWSDPVEPLTTNPFNRRFDYGEYDKAVRARVCDLLETIGGVRQMKGKNGNVEIWEFEYDPSRVIGEICASGCIPDDKSHQYYPTKEKLGLYAVGRAQIEEHHKVLEPSAGQGGLADLIPSENLTCFEVSKLRCEVLKAKGYNVTQCDFLKVQPEAKYDRVVMNPPFSEGRWQAHTIHAASMVKAGGRLVAILPSGAKNKLKLDGFKWEWSEDFDNQFDGASVSVVVLSAVKEFVG